MNRILPLSFLCLSLFAASAGAQSAAEAARTLAREKALCRKAGMPLTPAEMRRRPPVPPERNAAALFRKVDALFKADRFKESDWEEAAPLLGLQAPTGDALDKARAAVERNRELIELAKEAASKPDCDFQRKWELGSKLAFPEFVRIRALTRWVAADAALIALSGDAPRAIAQLAAARKLGTHAQSDRTIIATLVAVACDAILFRAMERILFRSGPNSPAAAKLAEVLSVPPRTRAFPGWFDGETILVSSVLDRLRKGDVSVLSELDDPESAPKSPPASFFDTTNLHPELDMANATGLALFRDLRSAVRLPYPVARNRMEGIVARAKPQRDRPWHDVASLVVLPLPLAYDSVVAIFAKSAVLEAGARVLTHWTTTGRFPASLAEAHCSFEDPFDLKPLRYRRDGSGFTIWSVGETLKYDGGEPEDGRQNREAVFRYP